MNPIRGMVNSANRLRFAVGETRRWMGRSFEAPSPNWVKRKVIMRLGIRGGTWIETGTYFGDTTACMARTGDRVISIEPQESLHARAKARFARMPNVELLLGSSEQVFPAIMARLSGDATFWLDGHFSGGRTYQSESDTPVRLELEEIARRLPSLGRLCVMVDDIRHFRPEDPGCADYPSLDWVVDWCRTHGLRWHVEHDMLVARRG